MGRFDEIEGEVRGGQRGSDLRDGLGGG